MKLSPLWRFPRKLNAIMDTLDADRSLAAHVKYHCALLCPWAGANLCPWRFVTVYSVFVNPTLAKFVKCLESLPNLHTLEVGCGLSSITTSLKNALDGVQLPQIKALIMSAPFYPLLEHCHNVEDVVWLVEYRTVSSDEVLGSLASNQDSKVKRLAIPLFSWGHSSRKRCGTLWGHWLRTVIDRLNLRTCDRVSEAHRTYPHLPLPG